MEPLRRRLLNLVTALSLLLFVAVVALWVRSRWVADRVDYRAVSPGERRCWDYGFESTDGRLLFTCRTTSFEQGVAYEMFVHDTGSGLAYTNRRAYDPVTWTGWPSVWNTLGFRRYADHDTKKVTRFRPDGGDAVAVGAMSRDEVQVHVPHWSVWLVFLAGGSPLVRRSIDLATKRTRSSSGKCPACGYDLRATPDRCPECGSVPRP